MWCYEKFGAHCSSELGGAPSKPRRNFMAELLQLEAVAGILTGRRRCEIAIFKQNMNGNLNIS